MPQHFKGDKLELQIYGAAQPVFRQLYAEMRKWFEDAYNSAGLGAILYDDNKVPLARTMDRDIFIAHFGAVLKQWEYIGSFESYIYVFMQIFGPNTQITFDRLRPGALKITIRTNQTSLFKWLEKIGGDYVSDHDGNNINFRALAGIGNFYEVQSVLDSLNPAGIYLLVDFKLI